MKKKKVGKEKFQTEKFTKKEIRFLKTLNTPAKLQDFLDTVEYNKGRRIAIVEVLRRKIGDCMESAMFASYVLKLNKIDNYLIDLYCFDDSDHIICVYKKNKLFGAVAHSKYLGLRSKSPVYRSLRELTMSYFEHFFNFRGKLDLRMISVPVRLPKDDDWTISRRFMYRFEEKIDAAKHIYIVPKNIKIPRISKDVFERELMLLPKNAYVGKKYLNAAKKIRKI